jgi:endonuclease/exonuclease/phosphatase family metal-dependent hydrolase
MDERPRFSLSKNQLIPLPSHLFYFSEDELKRGKKNRALKLARKLNELDVDLVLLQEVGAGNPRMDKTCSDFYQVKQALWHNTALEISSLTNYNSALACRGNLGWFTDAKTFQDLSITTKAKNSKIVFKKGDNPYPKGILIEGFAILFKKNIKLLENKIVKLPYNNKGEELSFQLSRFLKDQKELTVINLHLGHKLQHFEQAIAIRSFLENMKPEHLIIGGDFNARDDLAIEASMIPWYIKKSQYDFSEASLSFSKIETLKELILKTNNSSYKPWATITDETELKNRTEEAKATYVILAQNNPVKLNEAETAQACISDKRKEQYCKLSDRIDYIFSANAQVERYFFLGSKYYWSELDFYSDHAGVYAEFIF